MVSLYDQLRTAVTPLRSSPPLFFRFSLSLPLPLPTPPPTSYLCYYFSVYFDVTVSRYTMPSPRIAAILLFPRATLSSSSTYRSISTQRLRPQLHPCKHPQRSSRPNISLFSTSNPAQAREANFYEILDVPTTASAAEIKKYAQTHTQHVSLPLHPCISKPHVSPILTYPTLDNSTPSQCATTQTATAQTQTQANASPAFPPPTTSSAMPPSAQSTTATTASIPRSTPRPAKPTPTNARWAATAATPAHDPPAG